MNEQELQKLISELQNGNAQQRRAASYKLSKSKNAAAVPALIQACNDADNSVRQNVKDGLRNIGSPEVTFLSSHVISPAPKEITTNANGRNPASGKNKLADSLGLATITLCSELLDTGKYRETIEKTTAFIEGIEEASADRAELGAAYGTYLIKLYELRARSRYLLAVQLDNNEQLTSTALLDVEKALASRILTLRMILSALNCKN